MDFSFISENHLDAFYNLLKYISVEDINLALPLQVGLDDEIRHHIACLAKEQCDSVVHSIDLNNDCAPERCESISDIIRLINALDDGQLAMLHIFIKGLYSMKVEKISL